MLSQGKKDMSRIRIAIEGCCHGDLNNIYAALLQKTEQIGQPLPDLLIICGDFQSLRNKLDMKCISIPPKYQRMGDFQEYYTGAKKAPVLTLFVGGNHELSNYLDELKFGGWVAPNIYFMGHSGVVWYKGVRISGISGIWNPADFNLPRGQHFSDPRYLRSSYHVRKLDFFKQYLIRQPLSVTVSHDWPKDIVHHGNLKWLLQKKPFFKKDIETGRLGSLVNKTLLEKQRPLFWFSSHLHVKFEALVEHKLKKRRNSSFVDAGLKKVKQDENVEHSEQISEQNADEIAISMSSDEDSDLGEGEVKVVEVGSKDEILLEIPSSESDSEDEVPRYEDENESVNVKPVNVESVNVKPVERPGPEPVETNSTEELEPKDSSQSSQWLENDNLSTEFLALDKCLPRRNFLDLRLVPVTSQAHPSYCNDELYVDREFVAVSRVVHNSFSRTEYYRDLHKFERIFDLDSSVRLELEREIDIEMAKVGKLPDDKFVIRREAFVQTAPLEAEQLELYENPQTKAFVGLFGV